jgi:para-aminobenzoate synthetase component 1
VLYICAVGFPEKNYHLAKSLAKTNFEKVYNLLSKIDQTKNYREKTNHKKQTIERLSSNFTKENYLLAVQKAKEYIRRGDIYQVNLSQRFQTRTNLSGVEIYKRLRQISPSSFSAYLDAGDHQILSSSPERFLRLEGNTVTTRPMKGTRPRSNNRIQDASFRRALLNSAKDKAELVMIVDLERNDLGRVCNYDSVRVDTLRELEKYSTVFQTTATVSGRLHRNKDRIDLLRACFPGGSITGCPKIRAMEIIEELEPTRRSIYTGSLGYLSFSGGMDFNILIRTMLKKENKLYFGVGGGIVADSNPEAEYEETLVKARAMIESIEGRP